MAATPDRYGLFVEETGGMCLWRATRVADDTAPTLEEAVAAAVEALGEGADRVTVSVVRYDAEAGPVEVTPLMTLTGTDALEDELDRA